LTISELLDQRGPPRHLEPRREITLHEARRYLRAHSGRQHRIRKVAKAMRLSESTVGRVWREMLR